MVLPNHWHAIGEPASEAEAEALEKVRTLLPDDPMCHAWTNVDVPDRNGRLHEVDLILLLRQGLFVVELKGWHGRVVGRINDWRQTDPKGRIHQERNPVSGVNYKAKLLKGVLLEEGELDRMARGSLWVEPAVVMHGLGSTVELSERTRAHVYGLDGYSVKGVTQFSQVLRRPARHDKAFHDAVRRWVEKSGLCPRAAGPQAVLATPQPRGTEPAPAAQPEPVDSPPAQATAPAPPAPLFVEFADEDLRSLGVADQDLSVVRSANDVEALIGRIPDPVWDDLEAVAGGEEPAAVIERRRLANERFALVERAAEQAGWRPEGAASPEGAEQEELDPAYAPTPPAEPEPPAMSELERRLREAFGDKVASDARRDPEPAPEVSRPTPKPQSHRLPALVVPAETLLNMARSEAMAGRTDAARDLHARVRTALDGEFRVDWTLDEVDTLAAELRAYPHLARRLAVYVEDLRAGEPRTPAIEPGPVREIGHVWTRSTHGATYSLLVRVQDVLDRRSGIYLSQVIGPEAARRVNERLRLGRPDGGRIRVLEDGTVISRRDPEAPWFVVGQVASVEWFPAETARAA